MHAGPCQLCSRPNEGMGIPYFPIPAESGNGDSDSPRRPRLLPSQKKKICPTGTAVTGRARAAVGRWDGKFSRPTFFEAGGTEIPPGPSHLFGARWDRFSCLRASASFKLSLEISSCPDASSRHVDVVDFCPNGEPIFGLQGRLPFFVCQPIHFSGPVSQWQSGQVRYIARPKSATMRVTRKLGLPPRYRRV